MSAAQSWDGGFLARSPAYDILRPACAGLDLGRWPEAAQLSRAAAALPTPPRNAAGRLIRFVDARGVDEGGYEARVHATGEVACRAQDWHDFMNALVWMTFPLAKAALNARHVAAMTAETPGRRGRVRDALTLFDEGGALVLCSEQAVLEDIRAFRWKEVFWRQRARFLTSTRVLVFGHAMHQKLLEPFVGVSALALLASIPEALLRADADVLVRHADAWAARALSDVEGLRTPRDLAPLPILGVPGWFARGDDASFYDDTGYFRPGRGRPERDPVA